jgi:RNA polymerase sigma factor (sigma-70 family)
MEYKTEHDILIGCHSRQHKAQTALYNLYKGRLLGICRRYCRTLAEAEDIFQDAFVKIFLKIESIHKSESLGGWVKTVVVNTAIDHYRKNLKDNSLVEITGIEISADSDDELDFTEIEREQLLNIISAMPVGYRMAINMYYLDGYKHQEIADMLGISINTSKTQLFHAKAWLKLRLRNSNKVFANIN